jgi:cardiolipin synthase A/B
MLSAASLRSRRVTLIVLIMCALWLGGCGTMPNAFELIHERSMYRQPSEVVTDQGPLSTSQSEALVHNLEARSGTDRKLARQLTFEEAISGSPLVTGNKVTLLENGPTTYNAMFEAIETAEHSINLETYIFDADQMGDRFADALIAKQEQGVQVNVIYDGFGSLFDTDRMFDRMRAKGINVIEFDPLNPLAAGFRWSPLHRDHRKVMIIDGKTAITGGINISAVYSGKLLKTKPSTAQILQSWRDTDVQVEGPAVSEFQELFIANWRQQGGPQLHFADYFPAPRNAGTEIVSVLGSAPEEFSTIYVTLISAIRNAESNIYITDAYFAPGPQFIESLEAAARRGVDVRILLPGQDNEPLIQPAARSNFAQLLEAGVRIYEWKGKMLHAKTATIDGVWSTVGSSNLDWWSIARNDEINTLVLSVRFADQMNEMFMSDLQNAREIKLAEWQERSWYERLKESFARFLQPML